MRFRKKDAKKLLHKKRRYIISGFVLLIALGGLLFYFFQHAGAFAGNNGLFAYASSSSRGRVYNKDYTYSTTVGAAFNKSQISPPTTTSTVQFVVNRAAPTRNEFLVGRYSVDGYLDMFTCSSGCSTSASYTNQWNTQVLGTNVVHRAYDIAYEQLSGRGMVVYAGNTTGSVYYCLWDGSNWGPVSNCAPTTGTNDIPLTDGTNTMSGTPAWIRLIPTGTQFGDYRTNQLLLAVEDTNSNLFLDSWNGSSWVSADRLVITSSLTQNSSQPFDIAYESISGMEVAAYASGTTISYRTSTGSGWSTQSTVASLGGSNSPAWVRLASDSQSNRISAIAIYGSSNPRTTVQYIWKTNGTTAGWTAGGTYGSSAQDTADDIATAWLKANGGTSKAMFVVSNNGSGSSTWVPTTSTWTQSGGFTSWTNMSNTSGAANDVNNNENLAASPNSDIMMDMVDDRDCRINARTFNGSSWSTGWLTTTAIATNTSTTTSGCSTNTYHAQDSLMFDYIPYSPWSLNWRVYSDYTDTTPNTPLGSEDTETAVKPNATVRLRINVAELAGSGFSGSRKKLQYSTGASCPDTTSCSWTDVGASGSGSIWRFASGGVTDDSDVTTTVLDGSTEGGKAYTQNTGTSADAPDANNVREYDYTIQNNGATLDQDYYFRLYDNGPSTSGGSSTNLNAIFREQTLDINGTESTNCYNGVSAHTCSYPTLLPHLTSPQRPHFYYPTDGAVNVSNAPIIQLKSADNDNDYIQYVVEWCPTNSWPCASGGGSFDQTSSQTNWSGQDADSSLAYTGNNDEQFSTMGQYQVPAGNFKPNTTYYLRAKALAPAGSPSYSPYSSTVSFTTSSLEILIRGGTTINGGSNLIIGNTNKFGLVPLLDNFNRSDSTGLGSSWGTVSGGFTNFNVVSNTANDPSGTTFAWDYWSDTQFYPNVEAYATIVTTSTDTLRICGRFDPVNQNGYCVQEAGGTWNTRRFTGGTGTTIGSTATQAISIGDKIGIQIVGTTVAAYYYSNASGTWTQLISTTDSTYSGNGYLAMYSRGINLDDFYGGMVSY